MIRFNSILSSVVSAHEKSKTNDSDTSGQDRDPDNQRREPVDEDCIKEGNNHTCKKTVEEGVSCFEDI